MAAFRSTHSRAGVSGVVALGIAVITALAVISVAFTGAVYVLLRLPPAAPAPDCPSGTSLYTRSVVLGKALVPIQHCFRDSDARDPQSTSQ